MESGTVFETQEIKRVRNVDVDSCIRALGTMLEGKLKHKIITRRHQQEGGKGFIYDAFIEERGLIHQKTHFLFKVFIDFKVPGNPKKGIEVSVETKKETVEKFKLDVKEIENFIKKYIVG